MKKIIRNIHFTEKASKVLAIFKDVYKSQNAYVNKAVVWFANYQTTVVRITNLDSSMAHFAVIPEHTLDDLEGLMLKIALKVNNLSQDIRKIGLGRFKCEVIGVFKAEREATDFCLYAMNKWMDEGKMVYNSEPFRKNGRFLVIPVDVNEIHPILEECLENHLSFPEYVAGLVKRYVKDMGKIRESLANERKYQNSKLKKEGLPSRPRRRRVRGK